MDDAWPNAAEAPAPEEVAPEQPATSDAQEGVQVGGLSYTQNEDGTRNYPGQREVETEDHPE